MTQHARSPSFLMTCFLITLLLCAGPAWADEAAQESPEDVRVLGEALHDQLVEVVRKPIPGWEGRMQYAWKIYIKPRASRMSRRAQKVLKSKWVFADDGTATALEPKHWPRVIQELSGLHPELLAASKGMDKVKVSERRARLVWSKANKMPHSIAGTPSYSAFLSVRADIARCRRANALVPSEWLVRERDLERQCHLELVAQQKAFTQRKADTFSQFTAAADQTRTALRDKQDAFAGAAKTAYDWMAVLQEAEEQRLRKLVATLPGDAREKAGTLLRDMGAGRRSAVGRRHTSDSRYGHAVRQGWSGPRNKVVKLLETEARAAKKAAKTETPEEPTTDPSTDATTEPKPDTPK